MCVAFHFNKCLKVFLERAKRDHGGQKISVAWKMLMKALGRPGILSRNVYNVTGDKYIDVLHGERTDLGLNILYLLLCCFAVLA